MKQTAKPFTKKTIRQLFLFSIIMLFYALPAHAWYYIYSDGYFNYGYNEPEIHCVTVTPMRDDSGKKIYGMYSGHIKIPKYVIINGIKYDVRFIDDCTFKDCKDLLSVDLSNIETIRSEAFAGCTSLEHIIFPDSIRSIYHDAFKGCSALKSVTFSNSKLPIYFSNGNAFKECPKLEKVIIRNLDVWCKNTYNSTFSGEADPYVNPLFLVHHLYDTDDHEIIDLAIPDGVTTIGTAAFAGCSEIKSVKLPDTVVKIGDAAFYDCTGLKDIYIPSSVKTIEGLYRKETFYNCYNLENVHITSLEAWCNIDYPNIIVNPLKYAKNLVLNGAVINHLKLANGIKSVSDHAFTGYSGLKSVEISDEVESIGIGAFAECKNLTSITFGYGVKNIEGAMCFNCESLESVIIKGAQNIGTNAFFMCTNLTSVSLPNILETIGGSAFENCKSLTSFFIPKNVEKIMSKAFSGCGLQTVIIPDKTKSIGSNAFYNCPLTSITLGSGIETIEGYAFACKQLKDVFCYAEDVPKAASTTFYNVPKTNTCLLHVHSKSRDNYKSTSPWNTFWAVVGMESLVIATDNVSRYYGDPNPEFGYSVIHGNLTSGEPIITCTATETSSAGLYNIKIEKGTISDDNVLLIGRLLTIDQAPLTISACDTTKLVGTANPKYKVKYEGFKNGETNKVLSRQPVLKCEATKDSPVGRYNINVSDATAKNYNISFLPGTLTIVAAGDANGNSLVDIADITSIVSYILGETPTGFIKIAANMNGDKKVNIADIISIINTILEE